MSRAYALLALVACASPHAAAGGTALADRHAVAAWLARADAAIAEADPEATRTAVRTAPPAWCQEALGITEDLVDCTIVETGLGTAAIAIARDCDGEPCDVMTFAITGRDGPRRIAIEGLGIQVILPDGVTAFAGTSDQTPAHDYAARLYRVDLAAMTAVEVAACAAPTLSPGGRWIVCRDVRGDIYRMPVGGGRLALVQRLHLAEAIYREPEIGLMLTAVEFRSPTRMHVTSITYDGERTADLAWRE
ncbi:MAG: hypothetical protein K8W52_14690 [Deltaproteobacteria bacterium]|nr:hypothetical protein [Deltaproteobacteria bacterium]